VRKLAFIGCCAAIGLGFAGAFAVATVSPAVAQARRAERPEPFAMSVRRITESQYRHIVEDTFGPGLAINARFEPELREEGLQAIGNAQLSLTSSGFEQYFSLASALATQIVDEKTRDQRLACRPADPKAADAACTRQVVARYGQGLFRRPLTEDEIANRVAIAEAGTKGSGGYYEGLRLALTSLLVDPEFLFRVEAAEPDPARRGQYRLDAYAKASRLSFLLWNAGPDAELLGAAQTGDLHKPAVQKAQIERLLASPRVRDGARAFFTDMLQFEHFENMTKDNATYPKYSQKVADSAREQTVRTLLDLLVDQNRDYREVFTSNETFINRELAAVYKVPYRSRQDWTKYTFPEDSGRSGILTQVTFLSLFSHPAASSPTRRGAKLHEIFMCQPIPEPPADVDFSAVQALEKGTVRERLVDHMNNEGCASCHQLTDPLGLALEHFDGLGQRRTLENGALIDVSVELDGAKAMGAQGVGKALSKNPDIPACLVRNVYAYGVGHVPDEADRQFLEAQEKQFAKAGYRFRPLLASIASSPGFFRVEQPEGLAPRGAPRTVASARPQNTQGGL
jgi:hypothetical protein